MPAFIVPQGKHSIITAFLGGKGRHPLIIVNGKYTLLQNALYYYSAN